ncbi:hypothetical protein J18TS1_37610 [Oceanobacillus oncorhynchi subsp. incaldanensis]|uniref:Uncharacterized protein n=1 Tax=Oceanobacillus oncorhynchi TaxID=545501 RepID=A0A0A1MS64_9BACI|nr:hypothetical protein [Oceanobacillus oncorhynchi]GIO20661.1 hypothetical protein J18TS1_37610 [Oceanobacillus oncorhynchi subsp. incaldanensis]CEI81801.1 hypothetical protein BN997_01654 [Oceanobacillus oncorhynchi]
MISKVINSYDIHINGQQLRIIEKNELETVLQDYENKALMRNEPRGSKYVRLLIFQWSDDVLDVELHPNESVDNIRILLKGCISSLVDRGRINSKESYLVRNNGQMYEFQHGCLTTEKLPEVEKKQNMYLVNDKKIKVYEVDMELEIKNITAIKAYIHSKQDGNSDYLVLKQGEKQVVANKKGDILAYPIIEVVAVCAKEFSQEIITSFTGLKIHAEDMQFNYYLISNSQFYIEHSDIYAKGFIIK